MRIRIAPLVVAIGCLAGAGGEAHADRLLLRDGRVIDGTFDGASTQTVHVRVGDRLEHVPVAEVASIRLDPRSSSGSSARPSPRDGGTAGETKVAIVGAGDGQSIVRGAARIPSR